MRVTLSIIESDKEISNKILKEIYAQVTKKIASASTKVKKPFQDLIKENLKLEPEYTSLLSGELRIELGIDESSKVDNIVDYIASLVQVDTKTVSVSPRGVTGGIAVKFLSGQDYGSITGLGDAVIRDKKSGMEIPWLHWLLTEGTKPLVKNYSIKYAPGKGRSGGGFMMQSDKSWSMPNKFAGKRSNNWITRSVERINEQQVINIFKRSIGV